MPTILFSRNANPVNVANPDQTSILIEDTALQLSQANNNYATDTNLTFGRRSIMTTVILASDLISQIGANSVVSATLYVRSEYNVSRTTATDRTYYRARCLKPLVMAEVTWNNYATGLAWETGGGLGVTDRDTESTYEVATDLSSPAEPAWPWMSIDVTAIVQAIATSGQNYGILLARDDAAAGGTVIVPSSDRASDTVRPELVVVTGTPPATVTLDQATLVPGTTVSGTYSNFQVVPTSPLVLTDSSGNTINVTVSISDNGDGTGTFTGSMPTLPAAGNTSDNLLFGTVTASLD